MKILGLILYFCFLFSFVDISCGKLTYRVTKKYRKKNHKYVRQVDYLKNSVYLNENAPRAYLMPLKLGEGVHTIEAYFGQQKRVLIIDTGSSELAFPCSKCVHCGNLHRDPPYSKTLTSEELTCEENDKLGLKACQQCDTVPGITQTATSCLIEQKYVEGSYWKAQKVVDEISLPSETVTSPKVAFGCIYEERGAFEQQDADGIVGFSRENDALFLQLYRAGAVKSKAFSLCLSETGGSVVLGGADENVNAGPMQFTPLLQTAYNYWTVSLQSILVGEYKVKVDSNIYNEGRGAVLDSGTTYCYIPSGAEIPFKDAWRSAVSTASAQEYVPDGTYVLSESELQRLPVIKFNLLNDVAIAVPPTQYMKATGQPNTYQATIMFANFAHATILGATILANHNILHDIDGCRIGIAPANCDSAASVALVTNVTGASFVPDPEGVSYGMVILGMVTAIILIEVGKKGKDALAVLKFSDEHSDKNRDLVLGDASVEECSLIDGQYDELLV